VHLRPPASPAEHPDASVTPPRITVQLCTHNRRHLLARVLEALFRQDLDPSEYEIVLVDDGSNDGTYEDVLAHLSPPCAFYLVRQANRGLAAARNAGIARARGTIILFTDDDVLATPGLLRAHLAFHERHPRAICRGVAKNVASFNRLPPPVYSPLDYAGAYFWTTNVSVPLALVREAGLFDERFREYGWEDLELGFRLRRMGVPSIVARDAIVYHYKPPMQPRHFGPAARQARAQARTAVQFLQKHPHWRIALATGLLPPLLTWSSLVRRAGWGRVLTAIARPEEELAPFPLSLRRWAARRWARSEYYAEAARAQKESWSR
jgi:GT2 family glycosyltransferase